MQTGLAGLLVALLVAQAPDAGTGPLADTVNPAALDVRSAQVWTTLPDGGVGAAYFVRGGSWWSTAETQSVAQELVSLRAENKVLAQAPVASPKWVIVVGTIGLVAGAAVGAYAGWSLHRELSK